MKWYPLPKLRGARRHDHVLRYSLYLSVPAGAAPGAPIDALDWHIIGFSEQDRGDRLGMRSRGHDPDEPALAEFLRAPDVCRPDSEGNLPPPTESLLDFRTAEGRLVVFRLVGEFWHFAAPGITTKKRQRSAGYAGLIGYRETPQGMIADDDVEGCRAVAFEVRPGTPVGTIAVNLHVNFVEKGFRHVLPVIIDPDGGNDPRPPG